MSKPRTTRRKSTKAETAETAATTNTDTQSENNVTETTKKQEAVAVGENDQKPTITIDGKEYTLESLGQKGREQLQNLRVTDQEMQRLQDQMAITQTARNTYARILAEVVQDITPVK
ncbi:DUF6447 family protein [Halomonas sp. LS-001]